MMRELAQASQPVDREALAEAFEEPGFFERLRESLAGIGTVTKKLTKFGPVVILVLVFVLVWFSRPAFVEQPDPPAFSGSPQPLTLMPGQPVSLVHAVLGVQQPSPHPRSPTTVRYSYGTNLVIDEIGGFVYSIEIGVPNRTWRGIQVGDPELKARGALALLANPQIGTDVPGTPVVKSGYQVYASADSRPIRTYTSAVRPPSGCYDATVELRPRQLGLLIDGEERFSVVGGEDDVPQYVVTRIVVTDRSRIGPNDDKAC